jgi:hypothetical protein
VLVEQLGQFGLDHTFFLQLLQHVLSDQLGWFGGLGLVGEQLVEFVSHRLGNGDRHGDGDRRSQGIQSQ